MNPTLKGMMMATSVLALLFAIIVFIMVLFIMYWAGKKIIVWSIGALKDDEPWYMKAIAILAILIGGFLILLDMMLVVVSIAFLICLGL